MINKVLLCFLCALYLGSALAGHCSGGTYTEYDIDNLEIYYHSCSGLDTEEECEDESSCHWVDTTRSSGYCAGGSYKDCYSSEYGQSCWTAYCSEEKYEKWCNENYHCHWVGGSDDKDDGEDSRSSSSRKMFVWTILSLLLVVGVLL